ncbi:hypothetical protein WUBG_14195 [Wuchereria bancrofti]|uniref:Uncharacterized protein n=1 Tax=Wuchereria bancrofti TaxID=6293 RepID=J9DYQ8_WUCBA|nr:hypothetical protein WUBG_14195 [Wuchereria bancrofti]
MYVQLGAALLYRVKLLSVNLLISKGKETVAPGILPLHSDSCYNKCEETERDEIIEWEEQENLFFLTNAGCHRTKKRNRLIPFIDSAAFLSNRMQLVVMSSSSSVLLRVHNFILVRFVQGVRSTKSIEKWTSAA